jgi:hypothetical protein
LSYTARSSDLLREQMEGTNAELSKQLRDVTFRRLFNLHHEFPTEFHRLTGAPAGAEVEFSIEERHLPYFLKGRTLNLGEAVLLGADVGPVQTVGTLKLQLNGKPVETWTGNSQVGGGPACDVKSALGNLVGQHTLKVVDAGQLGPDAGTVQSAMTFDPAKLRDLLLYCEFKIQS